MPLDDRGMLYTGFEVGVKERVRKEPHEFFTLWDVDPETHKLRFKTPSNPRPTVSLSAAASPALYLLTAPGTSWNDRMEDARAWLERRRARRDDWLREVPTT